MSAFRQLLPLHQRGTRSSVNDSAQLSRINIEEMVHTLGQPDSILADSLPTSQEALVYCWRAMKEVGYLLQWFGTKFALSKHFKDTILQKEGTEMKMSEALFIELAEWLLDMMIQGRHRGVVELLSTAFETLCRRYHATHRSLVNL